ncbi:MAG: phosphate signaling complex protein PhoU [Armatimonadota bacterium]|nr:phosphate signaling complex protein PhoU [Armatimonadota bacterium]
MLTGDRHIRAAFDQELHRVEDDVLRMGSLVGELLHRAVEALKNQDSGAAAAVTEADAQVDQMHVEIEQRIITLMATQQPMAGDLRALTAALAIAIDLERMADHADGIARTARRLRDSTLLRPMVDIPYMAHVVRGMLHDVLEAFARRDPVLAEAVAAKDETVDALHHQVFRVLLTYMAESPRRLSEALDLIMVAMRLERAADHVTNIAERVVFMATGRMKVLNGEGVHG